MGVKFEKIQNNEDNMNKKPINYMTNKEFYAELIECQKKGKISNELGKMFLMLAERYSSKANFSGYTYRDEMVGFGIVACCAAYQKFDPKRTQNPFAYFTTVIHNTFVQIITKEKRQRQTRDHILVDNNLNPSYNYADEMKELENDFKEEEEEIDE